ncbi:glycosyltransferase [Erythrobacter sp. sf7]|uniref:Glycosyltransferase n=1 Tax=Erythrobacter fulvus TaxID=2987523 RepID=A0ABT5JQE8_9SPHN|nr:glycosyltransferase [Erythrobacter fulvus]MDC8753777.1 glycosyltransferase [Erythrobacter fulvus]
MKKALFVDHQFHQKTRSADFFVDILRAAFDVQSYYLEPERQPDDGVLNAAAGVDIVILWQMDFLAPLFSAMGKPVIVIPMFDGSGGMPDVHWMFARKARFLNFSLVLNERIRMAGCKTMLLRYFPEPADEEKLPHFDKFDAFFWQRRPDHGIDFRLVDTLLGGELDSLHLHNAPDIVGNFVPTLPERTRYKFTQSTWFKDRAGYANCLNKANVFIAPRVAEGIGMALLEAMAAGKLVLAHDAPTNNEYISNWFNGILFNKNAPSAIQIRNHASRIARAGWRTVVEGRKQWLSSHSAIIEWVDKAETPPAIDMDHSVFLRDLWYSYYASLDEYVSFITRRLTVLGELSDLPYHRLLDALGEAQAEQIDPSLQLRDCALGSNGVLDLTNTDDRFIGEGWSNAEPEWRWAVGNRSEIHFSGLDAGEGRVRTCFTASSLPQLGKWVQCTILLNEQIVHEERIKPGWADYHFEFDAELLRHENRFVLCFDKATALPTDNRRLSVCFKQFNFSLDNS